MLVEVSKAVDDSLWFLRRSGIVQPDQGPAVDQFLQDREVASHGVDIERRVRGSYQRQLPGSTRRCDLIEKIER